MSAASSLDNSTAVADASARFSVTSLAESMLLLAVLTVFQRGIGFVRGVLFCRWMPEEQLGLWDLSFGFLMLAAPLVVIGIPGSFGRYVEHYRQKEQLRTFLRRTTITTALLTVLGCLGLWLFSDTTAVLLFNDTQFQHLIPLLAVCLAAVIGFNFLVELFIAMRQMRVVSAMQLVNSVLFATFGLGLLQWMDASAHSVILAYGAACSVTMLIGAKALYGDWNQLPACSTYSPQAEFWRKLLPFAAWLWMINLLSNLFEVTDRYMIVHFSGHAPEVAVAMVGDYHSSRIVPWLMVAVAQLFAGILLPHLAADWESGRRETVSRQMNLLLKVASLLMTGTALLIALAAPLLFEYVFAGKYAGGLAVLPWTVTYCVWYSLSGFATLFFCCAEKNHAGAAVYAVGLFANILLNAFLLPMWGLAGAVLATALANAMVIVLSLILARRYGMQVQPATILLMTFPLLLGLGSMIVLAAWVVLVWQAWTTDRLLDARDKQTLADGIHALTKRFRR